MPASAQYRQLVPHTGYFNTFIIKLHPNVFSLSVSAFSPSCCRWEPLHQTPFRVPGCEPGAFSDVLGSPDCPEGPGTFLEQQLEANPDQILPLRAWELLPI